MRAPVEIRNALYKGPTPEGKHRFLLPASPVDRTYYLNGVQVVFPHHVAPSERHRFSPVAEEEVDVPEDELWSVPEGGFQIGLEYDLEVEPWWWERR